MENKSMESKEVESKEVEKTNTKKVIDGSYKCRNCKDTFSCYATKEFWAGSYPLVVYNKGKIDTDIQTYCYDKSQVVGLTEEGRNFASFLFSHADDVWLKGFLSEISKRCYKGYTD